MHLRGAGHPQPEKALLLARVLRQGDEVGVGGRQPQGDQRRGCQARGQRSNVAPSPQAVQGAQSSWTAGRWHLFLREHQACGGPWPWSGEQRPAGQDHTSVRAAGGLQGSA